MVLRPLVGPLQVPKFEVPTTGGIRVSSTYRLYPQHSLTLIEAPRYADTRVAKYRIEAVKRLKDQEINHLGHHTQALKTLKKIQQYNREIP